MICQPTLFWVHTFCSFYFLVRHYNYSLSLSHFLVWFLFFFFELKLVYFVSKNLSLYQNIILVMLITDQHLVYFGPHHLFGPFVLLQSNLVNFSPFGSLRSTLVNLVLFCPLQSSPSNSVHSVYLGLIWSIQSMWSSLVYLVYSRSLQSNLMYYLRMGKYKFELRVLSIILVILIIIIW